MSDQTQAPAGEQAAPTPAPTPAPSEVVSMDDVDRLLEADADAEFRGEPEADEPTPEPEAAAPTPEPPAEPPADEPRGDLRVALREERERRRQAEMQAQAAFQQQQAVFQQQQAMSQYLAQLNAQLNPQAPPPAPPDFEADPAGYLKHNLETVQQALGHFAQQQAQARQAYEQEQRMAAMTSAVNNTEQSFAKANPDYYDALDFMRERMAAEYKVLGVPEDRVQAAVVESMRSFGLQALQAGANPAERIYGLAKARGYNGPRNANAEKLSTIAKGAAAARGARSSAPASDGQMSLEQAVRLSFKEIGKMSEEEFTRLAGG